MRGLLGLQNTFWAINHSCPLLNLQSPISDDPFNRNLRPDVGRHGRYGTPYGIALPPTAHVKNEKPLRIPAPYWAVVPAYGNEFTVNVQKPLNHARTMQQHPPTVKPPGSNPRQGTTTRSAPAPTPKVPNTPSGLQRPWVPTGGLTPFVGNAAGLRQPCRRMWGCTIKIEHVGRSVLRYT